MIKRFLVCNDMGCYIKGSTDVAAALENEIAAQNLDMSVELCVKKTGCQGCCERGPLVRLMPEGYAYYNVKAADAAELVKTAAIGSAVERLLYKDKAGVHLTRESDPFYAKQLKIALRNVGEIDPKSLDDYIKRGGYSALKKAADMTPDEIIAEVETSGLRGRGGAGFPTGRKWRTAADIESFPKYIICNGDEGDPGAFMDRAILEGDPHSVIEGMAICAIAIGAEEGFLYIRDEYDKAVIMLTEAIAQAERAGLIGESVCGGKMRLNLSVIRGGGAFVCGESTALMRSIEGMVGEPRAKYIRSVQRGLWDQPTVLNNVETYANIPAVISGGGQAFAAVGTNGSSGTKVFSLVGNIENTGLVEVPMGMTLRDLIYGIGGGVRMGRQFKAVQIGGPSGGCLPESLLELPVDFDTLNEHGAMMGSGGIIIMDDHSCMVEVARYYIDFLCGESCGKCTPCREGLKHMLDILTDICFGNGQAGDIELLERICETMLESSLCALGKSAPNPVLSTIRYFREEYEAHISDKCCPAGICPNLTGFVIDADKCIGCGACDKVCPVQAVCGQAKEKRTISSKKCISCGSCRLACRFDAIFTERRIAE